MPTAFDVTSRAMHRRLTITTESRQSVEFVDITDRLSALIEETGLRDGLALVFTRHTTTGLLINEHEPLLLDDLRRMFEHLAPAAAAYGHDDPERRTVNLTPTERRNGHSHCRAVFLRSSETLQVVDGALALGRWQRVFFVDFDGGQRREVAVMLLEFPDT